MYFRLILVLISSIFVIGCNKDKVEEETLWGLHQEPVQPKELPQDSGAEELRVLWKDNIGGGAVDGFAQLKPAIYESSVFVVNRSGDVYRRDASSGDVIWKVEVDKAVNSGVGVDEGLVVFSFDNGYVNALNTSDGSVRWSSPLKRNVSAIPVVGKGRVIIRTSDGLVVGLDSDSGSTAWQIKKEVPALTIHGDSLPVITGDAVLVGLSNGKLIANNVITGRDYWEADLSFVRGQNELERLNDSDSSPIIRGTTVYTATYQGSVIAAQLQDASTIWRTDMSTRLPMAIVGDLLVVTEELGNIFGLSTSDGVIQWKQDAFSGHGVSHPIVVNDKIVIGDSHGNIHTLDIKSGALIETRNIARGAVLGLVTNGDIFSVFTTEGELVTLGL
jgi:outer membrane protein assembly factor BamB